MVAVFIMRPWGHSTGDGKRRGFIGLFQEKKREGDKPKPKRLQRCLLLLLAARRKRTRWEVVRFQRTAVKGRVRKPGESNERIQKTVAKILNRPFRHRKVGWFGECLFFFGAVALVAVPPSRRRSTGKAISINNK